MKTPKERAIELLNSADWGWADANSDTCEPLVPVIAKAIEKAIKEETEYLRDALLDSQFVREVTYKELLKCEKENEQLKSDYQNVFDGMIQRKT
jgi:hypothetical protein